MTESETRLICVLCGGEHVTEQHNNLNKSAERIVPKDANASEYDFKEGVEKTVSMAAELLDKKPSVVIAFRATGMHVGKTRLASEIADRMRQLGIAVCIAHDIKELDEFGDQMVYTAT